MKIEIEYDLSGSAVPDYWMYTELGNAAVHAIVVAAKVNKLSWAETHDALRELAKQDAFGEATDTAVRECVYSALGIKDEPFYVW
jgi:hypothetical protein